METLQGGAGASKKRVGSRLKKLSTNRQYSMVGIFLCKNEVWIWSVRTKIANITRKRKKQITLWELTCLLVVIAPRDIAKNSFARKESRCYMGGGEYNNLGHHVYIRNEDGTYDEIGEIPEIPKFAEGGMVNNAKIPFWGYGEYYEIPFKIKPKAMHKLKRTIMTSLGFTNNYLKMHGLPMFRRYGK